MPLEIVTYDSSGALADAVKAGAWDVAFLAEESQRANVIAFTDAYAEIEATYLVPAGSPLRSIADVDRPGVRIVVPAKNANDLYLSRTIKQAHLVRVAGFPDSFKHFVAEKLDAIAGLQSTLLEYSAQLPGSRILDGRFSAVQQAVGAVKGREAGAQYLREFVEDVKASGLVAQLIEKNGVKCLSVAPNVVPK